ncbi:hypothetical protein EDC01DRAFT_727271 [Geopyxis carbonaria]|nr:hypothetical protein EDC01DRAFT_727271 [Geopyxis carbonaria]
MPCQRLPEELWRLIIQHLEYLELIHLQQTSRQFKRLVDTDELLIVQKLFRCGPKDTAPPSHITLHPVFEKLVFHWPDKIELVMLPSRAGPVPLVDVPGGLLNEYATRPAVTKLQLKLFEHAKFPLLEHENGVTVLHVVAAMCSAMDKILVSYPPAHIFSKPWSPPWKGFENFYLFNLVEAQPVWCLSLYEIVTPT